MKFITACVAATIVAVTSAKF
jgi:hypothetical protein